MKVQSRNFLPQHRQQEQKHERKNQESKSCAQRFSLQFHE